VASEKSAKKTGNGYAEGRGAWLVNFPAVHHAGIPDTLGVYRGIFIAMEWKSATGATRKIQDAVIRKIKKAGGRVCVPRSRLDVEKFLNEIDAEIGSIVDDIRRMP